MFKMMCTGTAVAEFNHIIFKASEETSEFIEEYFNQKICLADENSKEANSRKEKNDKRKLERQGYPVIAYSYIFPPSGIQNTPERAAVDKFVRCNASGIQILDAIVWLNLQNHGWEYSELLHENIAEEVK